MVLVTNRRKYCTRVYTQGCYGKCYSVKTMKGGSLTNEISRGVSKSVLGSLGKMLGSTGAKSLSNFVRDKTGSDFAAKATKAIGKQLLGSAGEFVGKSLGSAVGDLVAPKKKKVSMDQLLSQGRKMLTGQDASGMRGAGMQKYY